MDSDLSYLIKLQQHDNQVTALESQAHDLQPQIDQKNKQLDQLKAQIKEAKNNLNSFQMKRKELENKAAEKENLIKKHQGELNSLKSNDAYKAMLAEIDSAKNDLSKVEDEILNVMEESDNAQGAFKKQEHEFQEQEKNIKAEIQKCEDEKKKILAEAGQKKKERDAYAATVPDALRNHYDTLRQKRGGVAIVPVEDNSCGECRMSLTQSKLNDIKKAKDMVVCDSCNRILFLFPAENANPSSDPKTVPTS